jgi:hypothetical protein
VIHLGGQGAVVVPVADFLRLRALARAATPQELEDAEDSAAVLEWKARDAAGQSRFVPADRSAGHPGGAGRDRPAGRRSTPGRIVPLRITRPAPAAGRPGTASCLRSPKTQSVTTVTR